MWTSKTNNGVTTVSLVSNNNGSTYTMFLLEILNIMKRFVNNPFKTFTWTQGGYELQCAASRLNDGIVKTVATKIGSVVLTIGLSFVR